MNVLRRLGPDEELLAEEGTLFLSVLKWSVLAGLTGAIIGAATSIFIYLIKVFTLLGNHLTNGRPYLALPLVIPIVVLVIRRLCPSAKGHGTEKVIEAVHLQGGAIDAKVVPVKLICTLLTLGAGGSVGKEGPAAQIGAGLAYQFGRLLRLNADDTKRLVICGISAGFAAVFGTPISGAIFGAEVLYLGLLKYDVLFPCLVAGVVANIFCRAGHSVPKGLVTPSLLCKSHTESVLVAIGSGVFFGLVALVLVFVLKSADGLAKRVRLAPEVTGALGGIVLIGIMLVSPQSIGLGTPTLAAVFHGEQIPLFSSIWKSLATAITLGFGGSGGIITPLFVVGATSGFALGHLFNASPLLFGAFGMVAVLAAGAGTPIAGSVMAIELFGPEIGTYAAIACCTAYILVGHRSVYSSQILGAAKSASLKIPELTAPVGKPQHIDIRRRHHSLLDLLSRITKR